MSYSQIKQDLFVLQRLDYKRKGFFIDVGAFDGITISNTYLLEKDYEWTGICIEAGRNNFVNLIRNRDCYCFHYAVSDIDGVVEFEENHTVGKIGAGQPVRSVRLDTLFAGLYVPRAIDYISIDIEGAELLALHGFPFSKHRSQIWTIETNAHLDGGIMRDRIREIMSAQGYDMFDSGHEFEDWYVDK